MKGASGDTTYQVELRPHPNAEQYFVLASIDGGVSFKTIAHLGYGATAKVNCTSGVWRMRGRDLQRLAEVIDALLKRKVDWTIPIEPPQEDTKPAKRQGKR